MAENARLAGFYWVRAQPIKWEVARWDDEGYWALTGSQRQLHDGELVEINENQLQDPPWKEKFIQAFISDQFDKQLRGMVRKEYRILEMPSEPLSYDDYINDTIVSIASAYRISPEELTKEMPPGDDSWSARAFKEWEKEINKHRP